MKILTLDRKVHISNSFYLAKLFSLIGLSLLPFSKSASEIAFLTALGFWFFGKLVLSRSTLPSAGGLRNFYALFLLVAAFSILWTPEAHRTTALRGLGKWAKYFGVFVMSTDLFADTVFVRNAIGVFLLSTAASCLNGLYQIVYGFDLVKGYAIDIPGRYFRMSGSFSSPNGLSAFLLLAIPLSFFAWLKEKSWNRFGTFYCFLFGLYGVCFVLTLSRSAWFSLLLALLVFFAIHRRWFILLSTVLAAFFFMRSSDITGHTFLTSLRPANVTISQRWELWQIAWKFIVNKPFFGYGVNSFYWMLVERAPQAKLHGYLHNCYLQILFEMGLAGLALFAIPLTHCLFRGYKKLTAIPDLFNCIWIGSLAFLLQSAVDTHFFSLQPSYLFWMFWGLYIAELLRLEKSS